MRATNGYEEANRREGGERRESETSASSRSRAAWAQEERRLDGESGRVGEGWPGHLSLSRCGPAIATAAKHGAASVVSKHGQPSTGAQWEGGRCGETSQGGQSNHRQQQPSSAVADQRRQNWTSKKKSEQSGKERKRADVCMKPRPDSVFAATCLPLDLSICFPCVGCRQIGRRWC